MKNILLKELITKSLHGTLDEEESKILYDWIQESKANEELYVKLRDVDTLQNILEQYNPKSKPKQKTYRMFQWGSVAAAIVILTTITLTFWKSGNPTSLKTPVDKIMLISGNKSYQLSEKLEKNKKVPRTAISKLFGIPEVKNQALQNDYTLIVPKGKTYDIDLIDGTTVTLNADSKLIFPTKFTDNSRIVTLSGEAFFKVAKDKKKPFIVKTNQGEVKVLGTHFNIKSYKDAGADAISLIEGKVQVAKEDQVLTLAPGQEARLRKNEPIKVSAFDPEEVLAWKEGLFLFDDRSLAQVLTELEKWYSVEFEYSSTALKSIPIYIKIKKDRKIEDILVALERTNHIKFKKSGNVINVSP
ncbi:FecR family protein [Pedobacter nyackensis]|uniref:FecR family protein n=1 Tax=Pedobacter nyackensis TaxID=475255 RepID=A0A1W2CPZ1_9SPHI|nr:FecR family protein [Pedobacter nyackensis]SMC87271.1 FecR family protein [Pedobacter nyackensis]